MFSLRYRDVLSPATLDELEQLVAKIKAFLLAEHNDDGTHSVDEWVDYQPELLSHTLGNGRLRGRYVAPGFTVCKWHGAGTLAAKEKAQERLQAMVEKAITRLDVLVEQEQHLPTSLNAVKEVLDRGLGTVRGNANEGDNRPLIQIGIGLTMTPGDLSQLTVVESRAELPAGDVIDADLGDN